MSNAVSVVLVLMSLVLSVADYHAMQGRTGNLTHLVSAMRWSKNAEHGFQFFNALSRQAKESNKKNTVAMMLKVSEAAVLSHPNDSEAWAKRAECLMMTGQRFKAYAAASRAVSLDPTHGYIRGLHVQLANIAGDRVGFYESVGIYKKIKLAEENK